MKLKEGFLTYETEEEQIMVAAGNVRFAGLVRSNKTAAFIVDCLKTETTKAAIVEAMAAKYDAPKAVIDGDVEHILSQMRGIGALDE